MAPPKKKKLQKLDGKPFDADVLRREVAAPSLTSIRNIFSEQLTQGLTPNALAGYLKESENGFPWDWMDVAEGMEEKYLHYRSCLETRKRAVCGLERSVNPASDSPDHIAHADYVRAIIETDEFVDTMYDLLDGLAKGYASIELTWETDTADGTWKPKTMKWRDPRWYVIDPNDGETLLIRDNSGFYPIPPFKFITHKPKTKSGIMVRDGIASAASWAYIFQNYTMKDWLAFLEVFGMPLRLGYYPGTFEQSDKDSLKAALAGLGADAAAIVPEGTKIEFKESSKGSSTDAYRIMCDFLNDQISKLILGQTFTMGGSSTAGGGTGLSHSGKAMENVRRDILESDARQLCGTINKTLCKWLIDFNFGVQTQYPKFNLAIAEVEDLDKKAALLNVLLPYQPQISARWARQLVGAPEPEEGEALLESSAPANAPGMPPSPQPSPKGTKPQATPTATTVKPTPIVAEPSIPEDGIVPIDTKLVDPANPAEWPTDTLIVPPPVTHQPFGEVIVPPVRMRVVKNSSAEMLKKMKEFTKKYRSEAYQTRTAERLDAAITEAETLSGMLAKELRKGMK